MTAVPRAVVLLSGGLDSATTLAIAKSDGFEPCALTFRYGQRHELEVGAARRVAQQLGAADHVVLDIDLRGFGASALTDGTPVPKDRSPAEIGAGVPVTYVPARNTIFLSFALGWAEVLRAGDIFIGVNALDYSGYPDCRQEYIVAFQRMADLATRAGVEEGRRIEIHTPLINMTKREIVEKGIELGVDYSLTVSCYDPARDGAACGHCDACLLRLRGFAAAGVEDPIRYSTGTEITG
ncbi:MAG: 7-cyano-7-deazaguanine synthase QueC [Gemmatimonadota bacterium]|nr:MAG: 7-cyano-7-deazaguanine synthase QueC [Gemmatimonadota bacterium]